MKVDKQTENKKVETEAVEDEEFMLEPVPMNKRRSTRSQFMVWVGFGYAVTGLIVGGTLGGSGGAGLAPWPAFLAILLGMGALFLMTSFLGVAAQKTGLNLSLLSRYSFGHKGIIIPMAVMALLTLGWFASIVGMVGDIWGAWIGNPSGIIVFDPATIGKPNVAPITLEVFLSCAVCGIIFTVTAIKGMGAIEKVANVCSPLILIVAVGVGIVFIIQAGGPASFLKEANELEGLGIGNGITAVIGSWIAGAIMGVDLFRFNKNKPAVFLCAAACFIMTNPILNFVGYIGQVQIGQYNYVMWMLGINFVVALLGVFVWTTALWTTDNGELYCNSLYTGPMLDSVGIKVKRTTLVAICGVVGTILGALAFYQLFFADFINVLGSMAPPLCAPILADYFVFGKHKYHNEFLNKQPTIRWAGVVSFLVGAVLGYVFQYKMPLPGNFPAGLAAMIISFVVYVVIYKLTPDYKADKELINSL